MMEYLTVDITTNVKKYSEGSLYQQPIPLKSNLWGHGISIGFHGENECIIATIHNHKLLLKKGDKLTIEIK